MPQEKMKQEGWDCFDVAINAELHKHPESEKQFRRKIFIEKYALKNIHLEKYRTLLAPEIKHAVALAAFYMNDDQEIKQDNASQIQEKIWKLFKLAKEFPHDPVLKELLSLWDNEILDKKNKKMNKLANFVLPLGMWKEKENEAGKKDTLVRLLFNNYVNALEAMRECVGLCNQQIGQTKDNYWSIAELDAFFKDENNQNKHMMVYFGYKGVRDKIFTPSETAFLDYCCSEAICKQYIEEYYSRRGWFTFQAHPKERSTSMIDVVARYLQIDIEIYHQASRELLYTTDIEERVSSRPLEITFDGYNHFVAGKPVAPILNPSHSRSQPIQESSVLLPPSISIESKQEKSTIESFEYIAGLRSKTNVSVKVTDSTFGKKENQEAIDKYNEKVAPRVQQDTTNAMKQLEQSKQPASSSILSNTVLAENFATLTKKIEPKKVTVVDGNDIKNEHELTFISNDALSSLKSELNSQRDSANFKVIKQSEVEFQQLTECAAKSNSKSFSYICGNAYYNITNSQNFASGTQYRHIVNSTQNFSRILTENNEFNNSSFYFIALKNSQSIQGKKSICRQSNNGLLHLGFNYRNLNINVFKRELKSIDKKCLEFRRNSLLLGMSGSSEVYLGSLSEKNVAIKSLRSQCTMRDLKHFLYEALILSKLKHPNILSLYGVVWDLCVLPLLILEFMNKGSLFKVLHYSTEVSPFYLSCNL